VCVCVCACVRACVRVCARLRRLSLLFVTNTFYLYMYMFCSYVLCSKLLLVAFVHIVIQTVSISTLCLLFVVSEVKVTNYYSANLKVV
jgi:hypothetical protein